MNQINTPQISVCIPVYNGADFIEIAINSVLQQTFTDFELIVIDNNSTDDTISVVSRFKDRRIKVIQNDSNIGLVPNWNRAVCLAKGQFIKVLPADDFLYPDCLMLQHAVLSKDENEKISLVCGRRNIVDHKGKILFDRGFSKQRKELDGFRAINDVIRSGGNIIGEGGAVMFRKSILKQSGVFSADIFYVLDLDLWLRMLLLGNLYVLPHIVSSFRISDSSASVLMAKKQRDDFFSFIRKLYNDKRYKVSWASYKIGLAKAYILSVARNLLYKYVL
jgi:glycosyltransferase involved in cell wall biosynthesis